MQIGPLTPSDSRPVATIALLGGSGLLFLALGGMLASLRVSLYYLIFGLGLLIAAGFLWKLCMPALVHASLLRS
jgi:hypothetical protein